MEEFRVNPGKWKVDGNIIGSPLADLTDLSGFQNTNAAVTSDGTIEHAGRTFNVVKMVYGGE